MVSGLEYMERLSKQKKRLEAQRKRITGQKRGAMGFMERRAKQRERLEQQRKRILEQRRAQLKRALAARVRGEAITGMDPLERKKVTKSSFWRMKWDKRAERLDARARKFEG